MNAKWREICTTGYGIVVTARDRSLLGFGRGTPPNWIKTAPAAEAWALSQVLSMMPDPPKMTTDCKSLISIATDGTRKATSANATLARIWCRIAGALDGDTRKLVSAKLLQWTPAHLSQQSIGKVAKGTEKEITAIDWRANRLADALAKEAAAEHAADAPTVRMVKSSEEAARYHMALLGAVTHRSNHCPVQQMVGGELEWVSKRDSIERPKPANAAQKRTRNVRPRPMLEHRVVAVESSQPASSPSDEQPSHAQCKAAAKRARTAELTRASQAATDRAEQH